jgi:hypothetical protein
MDITTGTIVGFLKQEIIDLLGLELVCGDIKIYPGDINHIIERRQDCYNINKDRIPEILEYPDYVGEHPKYENSVEFIKQYEENILVAVRLENPRGLCVVTMYDVTYSKILSMLRYGRIIRVQ